MTIETGGQADILIMLMNTFISVPCLVECLDIILAFPLPDGPLPVVIRVGKIHDFFSINSSKSDFFD